MKKYLLILSILGVPWARADLKTKWGLTPNQTIVYGGDSIETGYMHSHYMMAWLQLQYPELDLKTYVIARGGTSIWGWASASAPYPAESQYERFVPFLAPDVFLMKMGDNGGDNATVHIQGYQALWDNWINPGSAKLVVIGMNPRQLAGDPVFAEAKNNAEETWVTTMASKYPGRIFDGNTYAQMGTAWRANSSNAIDMRMPLAEPTLANGGVRDEVHPGPSGMIVMAWAMLKGLGAENIVSSAILNAADNTQTSAIKCTISNLAMTATGGTFKRLDQSLPWAIDASGRANADLLATTFNMNGGKTITDWQDYSITLNGLAPGNYEIRCDGVVIGTRTNTQLAAGWNMAGLTVGPVYDQVQEVLGGFRDLHNVNRTTGLAGGPKGDTTQAVFGYSLQNYQQGKQRGPTYLASMTHTPSPGLPGVLNGLMSAIQKDAQPVARTYLISPTGAAPPVTPPDPTCDLQVSVTMPTTLLNMNQAASYTVSVKNKGPSDASNETLTHTYPSGVTINSLSGDTVVQNTAARTITLSLPSLAVGASKTFIVNFTSTQTGSLAFSTSATTTTRELNPADNSDTRIIQVMAAEVAGGPTQTSGLRVGKSLPPDTLTMPIGIPAPSGWGSTDPLKGAAPTTASVWPDSSVAVAGNFYIDNTHPKATDTNNVYGSPNKPRLTIPRQWVLGAGALAEIHGGPYEIAQTNYAYRIGSDPANPPTAASPCFIKGVGMPIWTITPAALAANFHAARLELGVLPGPPMVYTIIEGIDQREFSIGVEGDGTHHVCIRNCEFSSKPSSLAQVAPPGSGVIHDVIFYNNHLHNSYHWNDTSADFDEHGIALSTITRSAPTALYNVWILDNEIDHASGDAVQVTGGTNGNSIMHHIYIGRNEAHHNRQSGFWCKQASDVIMSQNLIHDMTIVGGGLSAYGMGSQYGPDRLWFLFNEIYNCGTGFGQSDSTGGVGTYNEYYIGNYVHDLNQSSLTYSNWGRPMGWAFQFTNGAVTRHVVDNTAVNVFGGIFAHAYGPLVFSNNTINNLLPNTSGVAGTTSGYNKHIDLDFTTDVTFSKSHFFGVQGQASTAVYTNFNGAAYTTLAAAKAGNKLMDSIGSDPLLTGAQPGLLSPLINAGTESDVYATFQTLYGLDIRKDFAGQSRPLGGAWDIGAIEKK